MSRWPVLCLTVLSVVSFVLEVTALQKDDVGVCMTKISSRVNKRVTYTRYSSRMCGKKKCIARVVRIQPVVETHDQPICCIGYEYRSNTDDCAPLCTTGCHGGRCVAPDSCQCDPPSYLDPNHRNTCINPVCDPPCVNADCTANNTCNCHSDFTPFNSTHCYKCEPGYSINDNLTCIPNCDHECVNGVCSAPNVCSCLPGYLKKTVNDNFTCLPNCEPGCTNGVCSAPNVCSCSPGYVLNGSKCEPVCNCVNAVCVAPDTCACFEHYSAINTTHCAPICDNCDGNCVAPNVCECVEGYVQVAGSCRPACNSTCENGYCSAPNECTCNEGYVKNGTVCYKIILEASGPNVCAENNIYYKYFYRRRIRTQ